MTKKTLLFTALLIILLLIISAAAFVRGNPSLFGAQTSVVQAPQTLEEAKELGQNILFALPRAMETIWKQEVLPLWTRMYGWGRDMWDRYIGWRFQSEWEQRKPVIQQEFEKEKQELTQEVSKTLWERFKELLPK